MELFNSIHDRLPIGSIILWEMPAAFAKNYRDILIPLIDDFKDKIDNGKYLVIDGQQRLISLLLAKYGKISKTGRRRQIDLFFCIDVGDGSSGFSLKRKDGEYCIPSSDILEFKDPDDILDKYGIKDELIRRKLRSVLNQVMYTLSTYNVSLVNVEPSVFEPYISQDDFVGFLEKLSDMFVKLNMQGHRVKMPDLVVAVLDPTTRAKLQKSFRDKISEIDLEIESLGWDVDEPIYVRLLMAIVTGTTKFQEFRKKLESSDKGKIIDALDEVRESLKQAIKYLGDMNIKDQDDLTSRYQLLTLGYYMHIAKNEGRYVDPGIVKKWLVLSAVNRRYVGRLETDLTEDITILKDKKDLGDVIKNYGIKTVDTSYFNDTLRRDLRQILLMLLESAYDFPTQASKYPKQLKHLSKRELHLHHIFPKDFLERHYGDMVVEITLGSSRLTLDVNEAYDHLGNITFISEVSNKSIGDRNPAKYLPGIPDYIRSQHFIPLNEDLYKVDNYSRFLEERIKLIAVKVNEILSK